MSSDFPVRCRCRRHAATTLRCARCSVPICPDCSIVAPVGMLCRECASGRRSALFRFTAPEFAAAAGACLAISVVLGWILAYFVRVAGFFGLWGAFLYGAAIAETALRAGRRKRGPTMEALVGTCAGTGVLAGCALWAVSVGGPAAPQLLVYAALNPWTWVGLGIAVFASVSRIRYL